MDQAPALSGRTTRAGLARGRRPLGMGPSPRRLRVAPWQGDRFVALMGPVRSGHLPNTADVHRGLQALQQRGVPRAVTPALSPFEAEPFYQAGFELLERLHLLSCPLAEASAATVVSPAKSRPGFRWHDPAVLDVDRKAFAGFWRFDRLALREAKTATPSRRFRVAKLEGRVVGYAVTGRAGQRGYLQRLAVDPEAQGNGIGSMLVHDSFDWLRRRGAEETLVNTQETNDKALALYERLGYRRHAQGLLVLQWAGDP